MTNFEKYKDEILRIAAVDDTSALVKGELKRCNCISCDECDFYRVGSDRCNCNNNLFEWLYEECKEPAPKLTAKERAFCETVSVSSDRYIARDECGSLRFFCGDLYKYDDFWDGWDTFIEISEDLFPFIKWEDEEPWSIEDLLKLEVE